MLPPNLKGTPIDAVGKRRGGEDKANNCTREEGECSLEPKVDGYKAGNQTREGRQTEGEPREIYEAV